MVDPLILQIYLNRPQTGSIRSCASGNTLGLGLLRDLKSTTAAEEIF